MMARGRVRLNEPFVTYTVVVRVKVSIEGIEAHLQRMGMPSTERTRDAVARRTIEELRGEMAYWHASGDRSRDEQPYLLVTEVGEIKEDDNGAE